MQQAYFPVPPTDLRVRRIKLLSEHPNIIAIADVTIRDIAIDGFRVTRRGEMLCPAAFFSVNGKTRYKQVVSLSPQLRQQVLQIILATLRKQKVI